MMGTFCNDDENISVKYILNKNRTSLCEKYHIDKIAGECSDFEKAINILVWLSAHTWHKGDYDSSYDDALSLLDYSFDKKEHGISCAALSMILSQCLLALDIKSRVLTLILFSPYDIDRHVVCEVYADSLGKWVMLDPTFGTYVMNENNTPLSVSEIRTYLADRKQILFFKKTHYNGDELSEKVITEYYAKDMFIIEFQEIQGCLSEKSRMISIVSIGYDLKKRSSVNSDYVIKNFGEIEWIVTKLKKIEKDENYNVVYKDISILD